MNKDMLLDTWVKTGNEKKDLYKALKDLTDVTKVLPCSTKNIQLLTVRNCSDTLNGYLHNTAGSQNVAVPMGRLEQAHGATDRLISEATKSSHMMMKLGEGYFFTTKKVLKTLCQRAGSNMGDFAARDELNIRFHRDAGYVCYMNAASCKANILFREVDGAKKVFAVFTDRYKMIPQHPLVKNLIENFDKEMGESNLVKFSVDNFDTEIYLEFPEKAKDFQRVYNIPKEVVPGVRIHISDTGESSFIIDGSIRIGGAIIYVPGAEYSRAHTKNAYLEDIIHEVASKVFVEYTKVPERLVELLQVDVKDPCSCIPKVAKYCDLKQKLGVTTEKETVEALQQGINPNIPYTGFDIANLFLEAGAELEKKYVTTEMVSKIRNSFVKAVFYKYGED